MTDDLKLTFDGREVHRFTWTKDAAITYESVLPGMSAPGDLHEYDQTLHAWVQFFDGETIEWSEDWKEPMPEWAKSLIDQATGVGAEVEA